MQVIGGSSFICLQDRALSLGTISQAAWSSTQDLLALVFAPASIVILRLSWQLVGAWSPPNEDPENEVASITALCWSPHGPSIVVGQADGTLTTLSVENMHAMTIHQPADDPGDTDYGGWTRLIWHPLLNRSDASLLVGVRERSSDVFFFMSGIYACGILGIPLMEPSVDISITEDARYLAVLGSNEAVLISALSPVLPLLPHWEMLAHWDVYTRERTQQLQCAMKTLQEHWQTTAQAMSQILDTLTDTLLLYRPDANKEVAFRELLLLVYGMTPSPAVRDWLASTMSDANQRTSSRSVVTSLNASVDLASSHLIPLLNALLAHVGQPPDTPKAALETAKACWLAGQRLALALKRLRPLYIAFWNWLAGQSDENLQLLVDREKVVSLFREDEFGLPDMDKKMKVFSRALTAFETTLQEMRSSDRTKRWQLEPLAQASIPPLSTTRGSGSELRPAMRWLAATKSFQICTRQGEIWFVTVDGSLTPSISISSLLGTEFGSHIYSIEWYRDQKVCILASKGLLLLSYSESHTVDAATGTPDIQCRFRPLTLPIPAKPGSEKPSRVLRAPTLVCGVARGLASVFPTVSRCLIFDLEDDEQGTEDGSETGR